MDDAQRPGQPHEGGAEDQFEKRYAIGARLGHEGSGIQTFTATDRWLHRPVIVVFDTGSGGPELTQTAQSMARVLSPNLIDIYDRGGNAAYRFVVCEHPMTTVAALVDQSDSRVWNEGRAVATAKQLAVALSDLERGGVETRGLHLGSIGIDGSGRVRLSPWPLAESPTRAGDLSSPVSELELVAWVLESAAYPRGRSISSSTADLADRLRQRAAGGAALTLDQLLGALGRLEPSVYDKPTGEVPVTTGGVAAAGVVASTGAMAATGIVPLTGAMAATGIVPSTGAEALDDDQKSHIYHRRRHRARWPLAVGAGVVALVAFLAVNLGSSSAPTPAAASNALGTCVAKTTACPSSGASQSPNTTTATTAPVTSVTAPDPGSGVDVASSADTTTTTTEPTTTTTTTDPASTTTTTGDPSSTTTTAPTSGSGTPSAPALP